MTKTALVLLAEGAEEMEAVIAIDVLRRGGIEVIVAGVDGSSPVKCSRNVVILPDASLDKAIANAPYDAIVLPGGGKGAQKLGSSDSIGKLLKEQQEGGRLIGAICAAPACSLIPHQIGEGKSITCYPSFKETVVSSGKYSHQDQKVVVDGMLVTSQGPGTAFDFALKLVEMLEGKEKAVATAQPMLLT